MPDRQETTAMDGVANRWVQWWWLDVVATAVLTVAVALAAQYSPGPFWRALDLLGQLDLDTRRSLYSDLNTLVSLYAGFSTLAFATYLGWSSTIMQRLRGLVGESLLVLWLGVTSVPWVCALLLIITKAADRGVRIPTGAWRWVAFAVILLLVQQLARVLWLFFKLADLNQEDQRTPGKPARRLGKIQVKPPPAHATGDDAVNPR